MVNIIKEELSLRKKIEFICDFTNDKHIIINWDKKRLIELT